MKKILLLMIAAAFAACGVKDKINVVGPVEWEVETLSRLRVGVTVDNASCHTLRISGGRFTVDTPYGTLATVLLNDTVVIPRRAETRLEFPLRMKLDNLQAAFSDPEGFTVSGTAMVRTGMVRKKIRVENESISKFFDNLAE